MESRKPEQTTMPPMGYDVESPTAPNAGISGYAGPGRTHAGAYSKDAEGSYGPIQHKINGQVAHQAAAPHRRPVSPTPTPPPTVTTDLDPVFGDQVFNIQWVLMIFWPLVIPVIVATFLPLCKGKGMRFPTVSYRRAWLGNLVLSIAMTIVWIIIIVVSAVVAGKAAQVMQQTTGRTIYTWP